MHTDNTTTALTHSVSSSPALARVSQQLAITDKLLTKPEEPLLIPYRKKDKWGFCNRNKQIVIDCEFDYVFLRSDGFFKRGMKNNKSLMTLDGALTSNSYEWIDDNFQENLCCIKKNNKFGFINKKLSIELPCVFRNQSTFSEGLAIARLNDSSFVFIDKSLRRVNLNSFLDVGNFHDDFASFAIYDEYNDRYKIGFMNKSFKTIIPATYESPIEPELWDIPFLAREPLGTFTFINGNAIVCKSDKWGVINKKNEIVIPIIFDEIYRNNKSFAAYNKNGLVGWFSESGKKIILLDKDVENIHNFDKANSLFIGIQYNGLWGHINKDFELIYYPTYENIEDFSEGFAAIKSKNKWGFINTIGEIIIPPIYDNAHHFSQGLAGVEKDGKCGFINQAGNIVIDFKYADIREDFKFGLARVGTIKRGSYQTTCFIDKSGVEYWEN